MKKKSIEKKDEEITFQSVKNFKSFFVYVLKGNDLLSHLLYFVLLFFVFKFALIPGIGLALNTDFPLTVIVSGSMEQTFDQGMVCGRSLTGNYEENFWMWCGDFYEENLKISEELFSTFQFASGLNRGDIIVVYGRQAEDIQLGDVILFKGQDKVMLENGEMESLFFVQNGPIIHRVINIDQINGTYYYTTKGDNNPAVLEAEVNIPYEDVLGVATIRVPYFGLINYYFYEYVLKPIS